MQAKHFSPQPPPEPSTQIVKTKKSVETLDAENLPIYYTCELSSPRSKRYVEKLLKTREEKNFYGSYGCNYMYMQTLIRKLVDGLVLIFRCAMKLKFTKTVWGIFPRSTCLQPTCQPSIVLHRSPVLREQCDIFAAMIQSLLVPGGRTPRKIG